MLAPNAKLRSLMMPPGSAQPEEATEAVAATESEAETETARARPGRFSWAHLLERGFGYDVAISGMGLIQQSGRHPLLELRARAMQTPTLCSRPGACVPCACAG